MRKQWRIWLLALALAAPAAAEPLFPPDALGPFAVGRTTFAAVDAGRGDRALLVDVWYPVDPRDATGPPSQYDLLLTRLESRVAQADVPVSGRGPFPLVVFSHGNGGIRFQSFFLTETLASHGFVVAAPDHTGNTTLDLLLGTGDSLPVAAVNRPGDVSFVISRMLERNADPGDAFAGSIDRGRVGVAGHSFGGFTALAVASGFLGVPPDPRVRAIVPISPASSVLDDAALASIRVPTLVIGGTSDVTTPVEPESTRPFALVAGRPRLRVDVQRGGHFSFTEICAISEAFEASGVPDFARDALAGGVEEGCVPELIPIDEAHRLTNLYAVAFLRIHLASDPRYERFLTPGRVRSRDLEVNLARRPGRGR
jgi:predicted dienelactone hydrolase